VHGGLHLAQRLLCHVCLDKRLVVDLGDWLALDDL
jgi:hypothetical protein